MKPMLKLATLLLTLSIAAGFASPFRMSILGPPGSGKSTQAGLISESLGIPHISPGQLLRAEVSQGTAIGLECQDYMDRGEFVSEELILALLQRRLNQVDCVDGYVLDGFPRTFNLFVAFEEMLGSDCDRMVLYLDLNEREALRRCSQRYHCPDCFENRPPPEEAQALCFECGSPLERRIADEDLELIRARLKMEATLLAPVLSALESKDHFFRIDANVALAGIHTGIRKCINIYLEEHSDY